MCLMIDKSSWYNVECAQQQTRLHSAEHSVCPTRIKEVTKIHLVYSDQYLHQRSAFYPEDAHRSDFMLIINLDGPLFLVLLRSKVTVSSQIPDHPPSSMFFWLWHNMLSFGDCGKCR